MLSACSSIYRGMEAVLATERAANRETAVRTGQLGRQAQGQRAALSAARERLERQGTVLSNQQATVARLTVMLTGPNGLKDQLAGMHALLDETLADLASVRDGKAPHGIAPGDDASRREAAPRPEHAGAEPSPRR